MSSQRSIPGLARLPAASISALAGLYCAVAILTCPTLAAEPELTPRQLEFFESKVRPLLSARCYECHSGEKPKGNLRLDSRAAALAGGDTGPALVAGKPDDSLLVDAIRYGDTYQMPPKSRLPDEEVAILVDWVRQGAPWPAAAGDSAKGPGSEAFDLAARAKHWCFKPIVATEPPRVSDSNWPRSPLDRFILARLEAAGLSPAPPADKRALLRRVTFDVIGLPPTPEEIETFLADPSPQAYEKVVDRLLASPHYGERWARHWLDLVRFAETYGHEFDYEIPGNAWHYRDYVVRALNLDLPYDQFVVEHLAGDLVDPPRRHPRDGTNESILGTAFYYFGDATHSPVDLAVNKADRVANQLDVLGKTFLALTVGCARCHDHKFDPITQRDYYALAGYLQSSRIQQAFLDDPVRTAPLVNELAALVDEERAVLSQWRDATATIAGAPAQSADVPSSPELPAGYTRYTDFSFTDYSGWFNSGDAFGPRPARPDDFVTIDRDGRRLPRFVGAHAAHSGLVSNKLQGVLRSPTFTIERPKILYKLSGAGGSVQLIVDGMQFLRDPIYGGLKFGPKPKQESPAWHAQDVSKWIGHRAYIELVDDGDHYLSVEQIVFADQAAPPPEAPVVPHPLIAPFEARLTSDALDAPMATAQDRLAEIARRRAALEATLPAPRRALAMADGTGEDERLLIRGNTKTPGDAVPRRLLEVFGGAHAGTESGSGRLALARQLVDPNNPLVARVIVNRLWHHHFGRGLVPSTDDFGAMGQAPSHPELLDWLATELVRGEWSLKRLHRTMLLSATYRMSSAPQPAADSADPTNVLLHRANVRRLDAESVRDAVLAVSGRLDRTMYGPGVMPALTPFMGDRGRPATSGPVDGAGRRSVYLSVRRNFLSPLLVAFDFPAPFGTVGRRSVSNVPAQALVMLNNPFVAEQSALWAKRVVADPAIGPAERVRSMFLAALSRPPSDEELSAAVAFVTSSPPAGQEGAAAAWTELAHAMFNLKELVFVP